MNYSELYEKIGYTFKNEELLTHALTRNAYARENGLSTSDTMDSLAVLGDAVLDLLVICQLIGKGEFDKGEITRKKIDLVNMSVVRHVAEELDLPHYMKWGKGELRMQVWTNGRVSAECFEALMGAVYLDGGMETSKILYDHVWKP